MKKQEPLTPIRRVVADSVSTIKNFVTPTPSTSSQDSNRVFRFESLEDRRVLSATGLDPGVTAPGDSAMVASEFEQPGLSIQQEDSISHLVVLVNGEPQELTAENNVLNVNAGDTIQISEVGIDTIADTGVFAAEAYLNKLNDFSSASLIDYDDGRFSAREDNFVADGDAGAITGVGEAWTVETGFDRLTVNLLHYTEDAVDVESRFFVNLQVGLPDFEFNTDVINQILEQDIRVGDEVSIPVEFLNNLGGKFHNYAEVDIYNANDPDTIIWAGALVGNASQDNIVSGEALNLRGDDPFSERFVPEEAGEYIFIYTVDPENANIEANELNNEYRLTVTVSPAESPLVAVDDQVDGSGNIDVLANDEVTTENVTTFSENENLRVTFFNEQQFSFGFGVQNDSAEPIEQWAVEIRNANYFLQADQLTNASQFDLVTTENPDGTYNYLFLGNSPIAAFGGIDNIQTTQIDFGGPVSSSGLAVGTWAIEEVTNAEIADFTQGQNGRVSLNDDGTLNYQANDGFVGQDQFEYTFTDGENVSNTATVTVNIEAPELTVDPTVTGEEDTPIELTIKTEFDSVQVSGVPEGATLNRGQAVDGRDGTYEIAATDLDGLAVTPTENSDENFQLVVTPIENNTPLSGQAVTIDVVVNAVIDGGEVDFGFQRDQFLGQDDFQGFGILEGASGNLPVATSFSDLDGSESHQITLKGLPDYISFSAGERVGNDYVIDASDLQDLTVSAGEVTDLTGFDERLGRFPFRRFEIEFTIESFESNLSESLNVTRSFDLIVFARP